jgi:hypothetical protein
VDHAVDDLAATDRVAERPPVEGDRDRAFWIRRSTVAGTVTVAAPGACRLARPSALVARVARVTGPAAADYREAQTRHEQPSPCALSLSHQNLPWSPNGAVVVAARAPAT